MEQGSRFSHAFFRAVTAAGLVAGLTVGLSPAATAQDAPPAPAPAAGSSDFAWNLHESIYGSSTGLPDPIGNAARGFADGLTGLLAPGLLEQKAREAQEALNPPAPEPAPAPAPLPYEGFDQSKCPPQARACIDLDHERTWLQKDGVITWGPVRDSAGAPYPATATPRGTFYVNRKVKDEVSRVYNNAPMPYSVYFTNNGIAFHEGDVNLWSHGCIHLNHEDAVHYFNNLNIGDMVYVF
ncbi:L,D-transpeptidase [Corynebacterium choanae]|nr:L,D-transpeptidase [Corynebacterium choanae]